MGLPREPKNKYVSSPFQIVKGSALDPIFTYKLNGSVQPLDGAKITFAVTTDQKSTTVLFSRKNTLAGGSDEEISFVTDGTDGKFYVHLTSANTSNLDWGEYWWEIKVEISGKPQTIGQNYLFIKESRI